MTDDQSGVVLYWRPMCAFCIRLRLRLLFTPLRYVKVNIWRDPEAAAFVRSVADGNETVPTVTVAGRPMVNPSKKELLAAVAAHSPGSMSRTGRPATSASDVPD
ncbi:glutaredoxin domain-containing protein [Streptomyces sp. NPDC006632]|uniref:glutaredoxin domain-containing protein n=1 Tax=unclassified Streptomyces TaxID=2593676 RepID=UPI002E1D3A11